MGKKKKKLKSESGGLKTTRSKGRKMGGVRNFQDNFHISGVWAESGDWRKSSKLEEYR
jgi:hypothetical protein